MYQQTNPIYQNSKAIRDMVLLLMSAAWRQRGDGMVHWKGRVRRREGMSTRGNKREERGGALINEGLFW
jgi:hypothetical protein